VKGICFRCAPPPPPVAPRPRARRPDQRRAPAWARARGGGCVCGAAPRPARRPRRRGGGGRGGAPGAGERGCSSVQGTARTERHSVRASVAQQTPNRRHSVPLLFGAELWISWFLQDLAARGTQNPCRRSTLRQELRVA